MPAAQFMNNLIFRCPRSCAPLTGVFFSQKLFLLPLLFALFGGMGCDATTDKATAPATVAASAPLFELLPPARTGVQFANVLPENNELNILAYEYYYNGGGVAIGDVNNDGLADFYLTANLVASRLYLNRGDMRFEEVTKQTGTASRPGWKTGVTMADVDGNGFLDIYVCRSGKIDAAARANELFMNNGDGTFTEKAAAMGLADQGYGTQAAFFDYDRDGDLDMFLINHSIKSLITLNVTEMKQGRDPDTGDKLFRNDGGTFTEVGEQAGIFSNRLGFGLGVAISDLDRNGWPDIFVTNDYTEHDYVYLNQGDGTFVESLRSTMGHTANFSMGVDIADINNDSWPDLVVLDMLPEDNNGQKLLKGPDGYERYQLQLQHGFYHQNMRNMLQVSKGLGPDGQLRFSEIGQLAGISQTDWSWSPLLADYDNDGLRDLFISNGYVRASTDLDFLTYTYALERERARKAGEEVDMMRIVKLIHSLKRPNYLFRNRGDLTFENVSESWGLNRPSYSNGAAYGDLDNDGDLDLIVNTLTEPTFIYQNKAREQGKGHFLQLALQGTGGNTRGIGAWVEMDYAGGTLSQEAFPTRGFQSSVDPVLHFGLGQAATIDRLRIRWPDGRSQTLENIPADQRLVVKQADAGPKSAPDPQRANPGRFQAVADAAGITFRHRENDFIDFKREALLPHKLSRFGPALAVGDVNGDGLSDVYIGGAFGQAGVLFVQGKNGRFAVGAKGLPRSADGEEVAATFFDADGDGDADLYVVHGGSELPENDPLMQDCLYLNQGGGKWTLAPLPVMAGSGGCVAAGDMDGDGDLDLFVGGRVLPGRYPLLPRSFLLRNDGGVFSDATSELAPELLTPGMVSDAVWADLTGDASPELLLVGEWMPPMLFAYQNGKLARTDVAAFQQAGGWWNRILAHDFDKDGDLDLVLGNRGLNGLIRATTHEPACIYGKDFDGNGSIDPITCYYIQGKSYPMHSRDELLGQMNFLKKKFVRYADYADATMTDIFSPEQLQDALILQAHTFASSYVENLGDGNFVLTPLPSEAQVAPVFGLVAGDYTGDGHDDLLLSGNFYPARVEMGRYDASIGLMLAGDGKGGFRPVPLQESGFFVPGDVRNMQALRMAGGETAILVVKNDDEVQMLMQREAER